MTNLKLISNKIRENFLVLHFAADVARPFFADEGNLVLLQVQLEAWLGTEALAASFTNERLDLGMFRLHMNSQQRAHRESLIAIGAPETKIRSVN
jgi:hypothetical protein